MNESCDCCRHLDEEGFHLLLNLYCEKIYFASLVSPAQRFIVTSTYIVNSNLSYCILSSAASTYQQYLI